MRISAKEFLIDLIPLIKENLDDTKVDKDNDYNCGKVFAYFDVLTIIQMQAQNFGINLKELGLDYDLMRELTYRKANDVLLTT